jgi:hypothetical protein
VGTILFEVLEAAKIWYRGRYRWLQQLKYADVETNCSMRVVRTSMLLIGRGVLGGCATETSVGKFFVGERRRSARPAFFFGVCVGTRYRPMRAGPPSKEKKGPVTRCCYATLLALLRDAELDLSSVVIDEEEFCR